MAVFWYDQGVNKSIVGKARKLMYERTLKNGAPAWALTEIAIRKGKELSRKYNVNENLVLTALYLAHSVFSTKIKGKVQSNHEELSARYAEKFLRKWKVAQAEIDIVTNSIRAHHDRAVGTSKEAEVMKNAECFKFLTIDGILALIHSLSSRKLLSFDETVEYSKSKAKQKLGYISLPGVRKEAQRSYKEIISLLDKFTSGF